MHTLAPIRRESYFTDIASVDYYTEGGERPGQWLILNGDQARADGEVTKSCLENLLKGLSRDGVRRLLKFHPNRQKGWDLTFSAPKSVSVLYALAPRVVRKKILAAHRAAVKVALHYLVREALYARRGKGGKEFEKIVHTIVASFTHITSRAADPQLHEHVLLANLGIRTDGTIGALWSREFYQHKLATGAVYRTELAHQLQQSLGVVLYRVRDWFEVLGIPKMLNKHFSKRSQEIRQIAREYGVRHPKFLELVTKATQGIKGHLPHQELHGQWRNRALRFGITQHHMTALLNLYRPNISERRAQRIAYQAAFQAIKQLTARHSYFTERQIVQAAAPKIMGRGRGAELLFQATEIATRQLIKLETPGLRYAHYTTPELYRTEKRLLRLATAMSRQATEEKLPFTKLLEVFDKEMQYGFDRKGHSLRLDRLNLEAAVRYLVSTPEKLRIIQGEQGSGKTTALGLAKAYYEKLGFEVIGCAPTVAATKELRQQLGGDCITVHTLLDAVSPSYKRRIAHTSKQLWRELRGKPTHRRGEQRLELEGKIVHYLQNLKRILQARLPRFAGQVKLGQSTVILCDEAQRLDTRTAHELVRVAMKHKSLLRIAHTLDSPAAAGPGGALQHVAQKIGQHELRREQAPERETWRVRAHRALRQGDAQEFLHHYRRVKALVESPTHRRAVAAVAQAWIQDRRATHDKTVIASDPEEVRKLNRAIRRERVKRFGVSLGGVTMPNGEKIRTGDRVRFAKNSKFMGIDAGDMGKVLSVARSVKNPWRKKVLVRVEGKRRLGILPKVVTVDTKRYKNLTLGYALLPGQVHAKAKSVLVLLNPDRASRESVLHQVTRAEKKTKLFSVKSDHVKDVDLLAQSLAATQQKILAHELEQQQKQSNSMKMTA